MRALLWTGRLLHLTALMIQRDGDVPFPWDRLDGRPLVYASLGTLQNRLRHVYQAIARAAEGMELQLVLALGRPDGQLDFELPANVIVAPYAPQLSLLQRSAAAITHAGLNTVLECIARGVPMVCGPITNDQPGVARLVEWLAVGQVIPATGVSSARVRRALERVLTEQQYRQSAQKRQAEVAASGGLAMAAQIVHQALLRRQRIHRAESGAVGGTSPQIEER